MTTRSRTDVISMPQLEPASRKTRRVSLRSSAATVHPAAAVDASPQLKPPLKWAGGKRWLVPPLRGIWKGHEHRRLVEPFCGGLAVSLGLRPKEALLNDINAHLINFYTWLRDGFSLSIRMENKSSAYYRNRARFNQLLATGLGKTEEAAGLFYYLNRVGYNGLCRFNRQGEFNVPFGRYKKIAQPPEFLTYRSLFQTWHFMSEDFEAIPLRPDDFVYADPPYDVEFTQYSKHVFGWEEQERTAKWLARHPGPVVLSNQATPPILKLYRKLGYTIETKRGPRLISCTGDRTPALEVLATRNL